MNLPAIAFLDSQHDNFFRIPGPAKTFRICVFFSAVAAESKLLPAFEIPNTKVMVFDKGEPFTIGRLTASLCFFLWFSFDNPVI
jgi:hypothetical protein